MADEAEHALDEGESTDSPCPPGGAQRSGAGVKGRGSVCGRISRGQSVGERVP